MKKEPTNSEILAELERQNIRIDRLTDMLEGVISRSERPENPGLYDNVKGLNSALVSEAMGQGRSWRPME